MNITLSSAPCFHLHKSLLSTPKLKGWYKVLWISNLPTFLFIKDQGSKNLGIDVGIYLN